jgi:hypothetical protein
LITVLAIRKSTAKRGSIKRIAVRQLTNDAYAYLNALIAVLIVEGPEPKPLVALIAVKVVEVKQTTSNFVKVLVDQFDGFAQYFVHRPSLTLVTSTLAGDLLSPVPLAIQPYHRF